MDKCKIAIFKNKKIRKKSFIRTDFCKNIGMARKKFDYIYCRFFLHTITSQNEKILLKNFKKISHPESLFFLEFRTSKDPLIKKGKKISKYENFLDHYRRFINVYDFKKRLKKNNFQILYCKESDKFAKFGRENPHICRIIFKTKY